MNRLIASIRRAVALFHVRSLEIRLHDQTEAVRSVADKDALMAIVASRQITRRELAKARANYIELLPPGKRLTFESA